MALFIYFFFIQYVSGWTEPKIRNLRPELFYTSSRSGQRAFDISLTFLFSCISALSRERNTGQFSFYKHEFKKSLMESVWKATFVAAELRKPQSRSAPVLLSQWTRLFRSSQITRRLFRLKKLAEHSETLTVLIAATESVARLCSSKSLVQNQHWEIRQV